MNLVKNGAVLLAVLGMFAATSCGSNTKKIDYSKAHEWVEKHSDPEAESVPLKSYDAAWDFTKTKDSESHKEEILTLLNSSPVKDDISFTEIKGNKKVSENIKSFGGKDHHLSLENFEKSFKDKENTAFTIKGNTLEVSDLESMSGPVQDIEYTEITTFDSECYYKVVKYDFNDSYVKWPVPEKSFNLTGHITITFYR